VLALVGVVVVYTVIAVLAQWPTTPELFRSGVHQAAQTGVSQLGTVIIVMDEDADGRVLAPYVASVLAGARQSLGSATESVLSADVPDASAAELRDRAAALLQQAAIAVGNVELGVPHADQQLPAIRDDLSDLVASTA